MTTSAESNISIRPLLLIRQEALEKSREFFKKRGVIEVDPPLLSPYASIDAHIDLFATEPTSHWTRRFLFSSPEYPMKRMIAQGSWDIFFIGHVFREEPKGPFHSPEFLMAEWYRIGFTFSEMIDETIEFIKLFTAPKEIQKISYRKAFLKVCAFDPCTISKEALLKKAQANERFQHLPLDSYSHDDMLQLFLTEYIEPSFEKTTLTALTHYPPSQAALSQTTLDEDGLRVAERFELYYNHVELANGYHELNNAKEQKERLLEQQDMRRALGKDPLLIDTHFLEALEKGMPDCSGVAVGLDRLIQLQENAPSIDRIIPIAWE